MDIFLGMQFALRTETTINLSRLSLKTVESFHFLITVVKTSLYIS